MNIQAIVSIYRKECFSSRKNTFFAIQTWWLSIFADHVPYFFLLVSIPVAKFCFKFDRFLSPMWIRIGSNPLRNSINPILLLPIGWRTILIGIVQKKTVACLQFRFPNGVVNCYVWEKKKENLKTVDLRTLGTFWEFKPLFGSEYL